MKKKNTNKVVTFVSIAVSVLSAASLFVSFFFGRVDSTSYKNKEKSMFNVDDNICVVLDNDEAYINNEYLLKDEDGILAIDSYEGDYIVGTENRLLKKYDSEGNLLLTSEEQLQNVNKIICGEDSFFVMFTLNNKSSIARYDYELNKLSSRSFSDNLIRDIYLNEEEGSVFIVTEYGEYISTDYSLNADNIYTSLEVFPASVTITKEAIYAVNNSSFINKFDLEGNPLWNFTYDGTIYKTFSSERGGVYFLDNESRSLHYIDNSGKSKFTYKSGVDTLSITELNGDIYIADGSDTIKFAKINTVKLMGFLKFLKVFSIVLLVLSIVALILSLVKSAGSKVNEKAKYIGKQLYRSRFCYLALLPILFLLVMFCFYPTVNALKLAFFEYRPNSPDVFVGFDNFKAVFASDYFKSGLLNLLKLLGTDLLKSVIPTMFFAEVIASIMNKKFKYASRVMLYLPAILPGVTSLLIWKSGILGENGVLNDILIRMGVIRESVNWLGNDITAIWSIVFIGFPWVGNYIILYGALIAMPKSYYEAAKLDGFSFFRRVFKIDIPLLKPQLRYLLITSFIGSFQDFQRIYLTTGGNNNTKTPMLGLYTYLQNQELGYSSAIGLIMFVVLFATTIMTFKVDTKEV